MRAFQLSFRRTFFRLISSLRKSGLWRVLPVNFAVRSLTTEFEIAEFEIVPRIRKRLSNRFSYSFPRTCLEIETNAFFVVTITRLFSFENTHNRSPCETLLKLNSVYFPLLETFHTVFTILVNRTLEKQLCPLHNCRLYFTHAFQ